MISRIVIVYCFIVIGGVSVFEVMYGLGHAIKSFAVSNEFVERMNTGCYHLGKNLQPFCFCADDLQKQWGVLDIAQFSGFVDNTKTLFQEIVDYRREVYLNGNFGILPYDNKVNKALFYDYLLSVSLCYVEIPKWVTKNGVPQKTYDKFLATRNPAIMAAWMGFSVNEMQAKYSARIGQSNVDFIEGELRAAKLTSSAKGNSVSIPRNNLPVEEMTCMPLFMLYAMTSGFWGILQNSIIKFTYLKDNETVRELPSTVNFDILMSYYSDNAFISAMLRGVDVFSTDQGGMMLSTKQSRGYIKVPELGCSKYDYSGVRSLNISRLLRMEVVESVDRTFIDVDLNSVVDSFKSAIDSIIVSAPDNIVRIYNDLNIQDEGVSTDTSVIALAEKIKSYVDTCNIILTTSFKRALHLFMIQHADIFPLYTGKPVDSAVVTSSKNFGIETMDF